MPQRTSASPVEHDTPIGAHLVGMISRMPAAVVRALAGPPIARDGRVLDPHTQLLLAGERVARRKQAHELPPPIARREFTRGVALVAPPPPRAVSACDVLLAGPAPILARVHRPAGLSSSAPCVVYFHGGGWVLGDVESYSTTCGWLAERTRAVVISIDYRLAPEHRFPAAVDDAVAAWTAVMERARELGVDPARVAVAGDSAGGNLAAVVARRARSLPGQAPRAQLLIYPATDLRRTAPSHRLFGEGFLLTDATMDWFLDQYVERPLRTHPDASPLLADDPGGVCPAIVATAGFDPLRDEGDAYAEKLAAAGVRVTHRSYAGLVHGFFGMWRASPAARAASEELADDIARELRA